MLASHLLAMIGMRRLERLIAVFIVGGAAIDRHGDQCRKKRGINNRPHERYQIEPLDRQRPRPPDQRRRQAAESDITRNLPHDVEPRVWRPSGICCVRLIEIGNYGEDGPTDGH